MRQKQEQKQREGPSAARTDLARENGFVEELEMLGSWIVGERRREREQNGERYCSHMTTNDATCA